MQAVFGTCGVVLTAPPVHANVNTEILRQKTAQIQKHSETKLETLETKEHAFSTMAQDD